MDVDEAGCLSELQEHFFKHCSESWNVSSQVRACGHSQLIATYISWSDCAKPKASRNRRKAPRSRCKLNWKARNHIFIHRVGPRLTLVAVLRTVTCAVCGRELPSSKHPPRLYRFPVCSDAVAAGGVDVSLALSTTSWKRTLPRSLWIRRTWNGWKRFSSETSSPSRPPWRQLSRKDDATRLPHGSTIFAKTQQNKDGQRSWPMTCCFFFDVEQIKTSPHNGPCTSTCATHIREHFGHHYTEPHARWEVTVGTMCLERLAEHHPPCVVVEAGEDPFADEGLLEPVRQRAEKQPSEDFFDEAAGGL